MPALLIGFARAAFVLLRGGGDVRLGAVPASVDVFEDALVAETNVGLAVFHVEDYQQVVAGLALAGY